MLFSVKYLVFLAWLLLALEADDALGEDDTDFQMLEVFGNHVEVINVSISNLHHIKLLLFRRPIIF